jgi:RecB family exonuclease
VFPTRRACLIFRNKLSALNGKPVWAPKVLSIGDFVSIHSNHPITDEMELLVILFDVYKKYWPSHDFGKFYPWGRMLLGDFDEADKQVDDPRLMFRNIAELKKIDATFLPEPESLRWLGDFLKTMDPNKLTALQKEFAKNWDHLGMIYSEFNEELEKKGKSYEGRSYKLMIDQLGKGLFNPTFKHLVFAGFHGFSKVEELMIEKIGALVKTEVLWDTDDLYLKDPLHEAGSYFRSSDITKKHPATTSNKILTEHKELDLIAVPLNAGQAKTAGSIINNLLNENAASLNRTAIILPDEKSLLPVLFALPKDVESLNVTMGFPLKQSQFASLVVLLKKTNETARKNREGRWIFDKRLVKQTLSHPLIASSFEIKNPSPENLHEWYIGKEAIESHFGIEVGAPIFSGCEISEEVFAEVITLLKAMAEKATSRPAYENDILLYMASELSKLKEYLASSLHEIRKETAWILLRDCINSMRIPFSGEPIKGLQVMGFLETRALDFENIIMLNVNEGVLPSDGQQHSFIPFALRKAFGLSTYIERESSYAYHFYRLLHRSKKISLIYDSEQGATGSGEPSRYIQQLTREIQSLAPNLVINKRAVSSPLDAPGVSTISITKDQSIIDKLSYYIKGNESEKSGAFSSSAFTTYINCSLQFYFKYIAGLTEDQEDVEKIDAAGFGNILHKVMEQFYKPFEGKTVEAIDINEMLTNCDVLVESVVDSEFFTKYNNLQGTDIITGEVIKTMVRKILHEDKKAAPFTLIQTEGRFNTTIIVDGREINLLGIFDRIDEKNDLYRILDYKTGKVELKSNGIFELFLKPDKKTLFQLHFYKMIYGELHPNRKTIAGFYAVRQMKEGISQPEGGISDNDMVLFKTQTTELIRSIFDTTVPFTQTNDVARCQYCPYAEICKR